MSGILGIATSGIFAFQKALDTIGNNIANVNTPGYSRQSVEFSSRTSQKFSDSFIGSGVSFGGVVRSTNEFANQQLRVTQSAMSQHNAFYQQALQLDQLLSQDGTSVSVGLENFFSALAQVNDSPDNISARNVLMNQTDLMINQFKSMQARLNEYKQNLDTQTSEVVSQINVIAQGIADINAKITDSGGQAPELLDNRDHLLQQLSSFVGVSAVPQGDGSVNVSIGSGEMLVIGGNTVKLGLAMDLNNPGQSEVTIITNQGSTSITDSIKTGVLGGLFQYKEEMLGIADKIIGHMAIGLSMNFNQQHRLGMDMDNQMGGDFFTDYNSTMLQLSRAIPNQSNAGTGVMSVTISDVNQMTSSDYRVDVVNAATNQVVLTRLSDDSNQTLTFGSSPPAPPAGAISIDGLTLTIDNLGNLANGDSYFIKPTSGAAGLLERQIKQPSDLAMATPVITGKVMSNTGDGEIELLQLNDASLPDIQSEFSIQFISSTQYNIVDVTNATTTGPFAYTPNTNNSIALPNGATPAYTVNIFGSPAAGDTFSANFNAGGIGDNRNGLALTQLQNSKSYMNGSESLFDRYSNLISQVGGKTYQSQLSQQASEILYDQAQNQRDEISAVSLDEEAANLVRFQQAYQAAAQLVAISNRLVDVLMNSFG